MKLTRAKNVPFFGATLYINSLSSPSSPLLPSITSSKLIFSINPASNQSSSTPSFQPDWLTIRTLSSFFSFFLGGTSFSCFSFYASAANNRRRRHYVLRCPSVRPCVNTYFAWRDISVLSGWISMKLATNIHHVSGHHWNDFQGHGVKVKVICVQMCECDNGGGIHFDGVASGFLFLSLSFYFIFASLC